MISLRIFFLTFYVKCGVFALYYAVLLFKFELTQIMAYSNGQHICVLFEPDGSTLPFTILLFMPISNMNAGTCYLSTNYIYLNFA